ncbi:MAG: glycosyltransferase family 4 protein [Saprospiraceae bacterium]|nr:glycosyltransferase family 4 protein [Saprospiraceae bacterium]
MRILINARFLIPNKLEGIGLYTFEIVSRLAKSHPNHHFILCVDRKSSMLFTFPENVTFELIRPMARHPFLFIWWFEVGIPRAYRRTSADLFFSPDGFLSLSSAVSRSLLVIHDLAYKHYPDQISQVMLWYYQTYTPKFISKANHIVTVSNATAQDLAQHFPTSAHKTTVIYNGYRTPKKLNKSPREQSESVAGEYFVAIGSIHPRKNIAGLIRAFDKFRKLTLRRIKLVIVGRKAWKTGPLEIAFENSTHRDDIILTGFIPDTEMFHYLSHSKGLVYVSFFEGFGLPIVDAMAMGVPVITSDRSSMKEIAGEAALLVDPENPSEIAQAMYNLVENKNLRDDLIEAGKKRLEIFSWDRAANEISKLMTTVVESS